MVRGVEQGAKKRAKEAQQAKKAQQKVEWAETKGTIKARMAKECVSEQHSAPPPPARPRVCLATLVVPAAYLNDTIVVSRREAEEAPFLASAAADEEQFKLDADAAAEQAEADRETEARERKAEIAELKRAEEAASRFAAGKLAVETEKKQVHRSVVERLRPLEATLKAAEKAVAAAEKAVAASKKGLISAEKTDDGDSIATVRRSTWLLLLLQVPVFIPFCSGCAISSRANSCVCVTARRKRIWRARLSCRTSGSRKLRLCVASHHHTDWPGFVLTRSHPSPVFVWSVPRQRRRLNLLQKKSEWRRQSGRPQHRRTKKRARRHRLLRRHSRPRSAMILGSRNRLRRTL